MNPLLSIQGLSVGFPGRGGWIEVVRQVSLDIARGEMVGLVGESGSGKSLTALAVLGLLPPAAQVLAGKVLFAGADLLQADERRLQAVRGRQIAMVFQEPMAALNPVYTVGYQVAEAVRAHRAASWREARRRAIELLERVALPDAARRAGSYPHQLSGGQCQRVMIAMSLAAEPSLLLADEPTTALDVTVQAQILALLDELRRELGLAVLLISHDLGVVAQWCERVAVLYAGEVVEEATTPALFAAPAHPYTRALLRVSPRLGHPAPRGAMPTIAGTVPNPAERPAGCAFHPRCREAIARCQTAEPELLQLAAGRSTRCWLAAEGAGAASLTAEEVP